MTLPELVEFAKRRLTALLPANVAFDDDLNIAAAIPAASHDLSLDVARNNARRPWLQQTYSVTLDGDGRGDLLAAVGSKTGVAGEMLIESIPWGHVHTVSGENVVYLPHYEDFLSPQSTVFHYYTLQGKLIHTRIKGQQVRAYYDVLSVPGPLTVVASYTPAAVTSWPEPLTDDLVSAVVDLVAKKVKQENASAR